ncbi:MAG: PQQ-binding-like beta-propeller repeat protein [Arenicellales bacterium]|nr:PQQ-binding-like beta-propeller repeat protein [Arenicellales bacterium]
MDKKTGRSCDDFGDEGQISLLAGMGEVKPYYYFVTSPATVAGGALVVGGWVADNQETGEPSGVVRGYSAITGELLWAWDIGREGQGITRMPPTGETYTRGTPNVWSLTSADDELGLVYVPTGNATPDYFGGHRTPVMDKYASSIVAIDAKTGTTRWHFQTTHHDVWDNDVPAQPTLVDLMLAGQVRKVVIVPTKRGEIFMLDRATGEPITEVAERPVPQTNLTGERSSPTQPFSVGMPSFSYPVIREQDLFGISPVDQILCRLKFKELRYDGPMTPPSEQGTLLYPGPAGGMNWSSVAVDEERQLMVVQNTHLPFIVKMVPRERDLINNREEQSFSYGIGGPQRGTPFAAEVIPFMVAVPLPCLKPPYGEMAVVDLTTQKIVWRKGNGFLGVGMPSVSGGSIVTAGGLIFNGSVAFSGFRAVDVYTGEELWSAPMSSASEATPMSYVSPNTGRQFVLVTSPSANPRNATDENVGADSASETKIKGQGGLVTVYGLP